MKARLRKVGVVLDVIGSIVLAIAGIAAVVVGVVALADNDWPKAMAYLLLAILLTMFRIADRDRHTG